MRGSAEWLVGVCGLGVAFILGTWWGLFLNLTHWHRMRRWACTVADRLEVK